MSKEEFKPLKYAPWEDLGITEAEYWKRRYVEARKEKRRIVNAAHEAVEHVGISNYSQRVQEAKEMIEKAASEEDL
jgi:hypothetical protein